MASADVLVLLATFNGGRYLADQLSSIERQSLQSWRLVAADDGSVDGTRGELESFRRRHGGRVKILDLPPSGSAQSNFFRLMRLADPAAYIALCDQDDIWEDSKLERLVSACQVAENESKRETPCLVHSDLALIDAHGGLLRPSFLSEMSVDPRRLSFGTTLVEHSVPGCSMLINGALLSEFRRFKGDLGHARMHDWWLTLLAMAKGQVVFVPEALVKYRQHEQNVAGSVSRHGLRFAWRKLMKPATSERAANAKQAQLLLDAYGPELTSFQRSQAEAVSQFEQMTKRQRILICLRLGILKQTPTRRLYQLLKV